MKKKFKEEKYIKQRYSEKSKKWTFQVFIDYYDENDIKSTYTKSFSERNYGSARTAYIAAIQHRDEKRKEMLTTGITADNPITVRETFEQTHTIFRKRATTRKKKNCRFNKYIDPICGDKRLDKVRPIDIYNTLNPMCSQCTDNTILSVFTIWKEIVKAGRILGVLKTDITDEVVLPRSEIIHKKRSVETDPATLSQVIDALRAHTRSTDKDQWNVEMMVYGLYIMYYTGMRPGEAFALKKSNVDLRRKSFFLEQGIGSDYDNMHAIRTLKTDNSAREIPIVKALYPIVEEVMERQDSEWLLARWDGQVFDVNQVTNKITKCCKLEGLEFNMYRLRHLFATDLVTNGADPRTIMELMGHVNLSMTVDYARSNSDLKQETMQLREDKYENNRAKNRANQFQA